MTTRVWTAALLGVGLVCTAPGLRAQSSTPAPQQKPQEDNPFPDEPKPAAPAQSQPGQGPQSQPGQAPGQDSNQTPQKPGSGSDNPFPGEDPNVPLSPTNAAPAGAAPNRAPYHSPDSGAGQPPLADGGRASADPDGDPVRSPDAPGSEAEQGYSSSRAGLQNLPAEDDSEHEAGSSKKVKTRSELVAENVNIGQFYLSKKNWKGAQGRFEAAFALDKENEDAVWGLAEAERHLNLVDKAREHYKLFLSYDPDGPHGKEARKELEKLQAIPGSSHGSVGAPGVGPGV